MQATYLHFDTALLPGGWAANVQIRIAGGVIREIACGVQAVPGIERHAIGLPGMPNLHSHAFQRGFAGLAERRAHARDDFWTWRDIMYRFVDRISPDDLEAVAALAFMEMLEGGFTHVGEFHYLHRAQDGAFYDDPAAMAARIAAAAEISGIGLTLLPVFYAHSGFGGAPPQAGQKRFVSTPDEFARLVEGSIVAVAGLTNSRVGIAPHSLRAVTRRARDTVSALNDRVDSLDRASDRYVMQSTETVSFAPGSAVLSDDAKHMLDGLVSQSSNLDATVFEISAYADATGSAEYNKELTMRRAQAIATYLSSRNVPLRSIAPATGFGATDFVATNATPGGRALNRRAEVKMLMTRGPQ